MVYWRQRNYAISLPREVDRNKEMTAKKTAISNISFVVSLVVFCLVMLGGMLVHVMPHLGWLVDGVRSGSMSPALERGSLVIAEPVVASDIALGDIIIYSNEGMTDNFICHRVVGMTRTLPLLFDTKGDANPFTDPEPVSPENIVARVAWDVPVLGYAAIFIKTPVGFIVSIIVPGIIIALMCLSTLYSEIFGKKKDTDRAS
jgi:signal peptidase I